ncbi:peptidoglycan recognition protein family protein [Streptomyces sp.]|uniref:peptidoglycan recognition protein family protein n=1 Tax=Streptomyces sp. TaxID=1931 RepID=UPI002F92C092
MAWYPGATRLELQPESDSQAAIRPTQFIVHSLAAPWTAKRTYEYWRDSTNLESHFGLGYEGDLAQYIGTETRADANASANLRPDGTGAVSIETASNLQASDPWTPAQVEQLIQLGVWLHQKHGIPLQICRSASDPGYGWHKQFDAWNPNAHACPGDARVTQFREVVFPAIVARATGQAPEEEDMPTAAEIAAEVVKVLPKATWLTDGFYKNPNPATAAKNPYIAPATGLSNVEIVARRTDARLAALQATNEKLVEAVATLAAGIGDLDPAAIVAELKAAIDGITIHLDADGA